MARSVVSSRVVVLEKYFWPQGQLNFWTIVILATGSTILGIFAEFIMIQNRMGLEIPWLFPYGVTAGALIITFIIIQLILVMQTRLLPGFMILGSFILLVLCLAGMIQTAILLFGPGGVSSSCQRYVNNNPVSGPTTATLVWLQQNNVCSCWYAAFSFWLVGVIFFVWMILMASQVRTGAFES